MERLIEIMSRLFKIYSPFGNEDQIIDFTTEFLINNCESWEIKVDELGNIMGKRGELKKFPLLNAHLDTRQDEIDKKYLDDIKYDNELGIFTLQDVQIGCDDKVGVAIILYLARYTKLPFKILLTVREEYGQEGMQYNVENYPEFYSDIMWGFTLDRKHANDIITYYGDRQLCSDAFIDRIISLGCKFDINFIENFGTMADTYYLPENIEAVNISVGYYNPHQANDYVNVYESFKILKFVEYCLENLKI